MKRRKPPLRPRLAWLLMAPALTAGTGCAERCAGTKKDKISPEAPLEATQPVQPPQSGPTEADYGDTLVTGSIGDIINLLYFLTTDAGSHQIAGLIYDALIDYDEDLNFVPELAASWEISDDKKTITFHLREDVTWQDGEPFDSEDVSVTFQAMIQQREQMRVVAARRLGQLASDHIELAYRDLVAAVEVVAARRNIDIVYRFIPTGNDFNAANPPQSYTGVRARIVLKYPEKLDVTDEVMEELALEVQ